MTYTRIDLESIAVGNRHRITPGARLWVVDLDNLRVFETAPIVAAYTHTWGGSTVLVAQDYGLYSPTFSHVERNEAVCELRRHLEYREAIAGKDLDAIRAALHQLAKPSAVDTSEEPSAS